MSLQKNLKELLDAQVITSETANKISEYYQSKKPPSESRLFIAFGILGGILVGLGIILILAHNWDDLSRSTKTIFAFLPLVVGQILCGFSLLKKSESTAWREGSAAFLLFAVGASIALVSQIYNLPGSMSAFLLTWSLLVLPLIYIMRSSIVSLIYLAGITWYACESGYGWRAPGSGLYWLLFLAAIPHYYLLCKNRPESNFTTFHNWMVPISLTIVLGTVADKEWEQMFVAYICLFGLLYLIGNFSWLKKQSLLRNGYRVIGALGTVGVLLGLSFDEVWRDFQTNNIVLSELLISPEFFASLLLFILAAVIFFRQLKKDSFKNIEPIAPVFLIFVVIFYLGLYSSLSTILINLLIFFIGVMTIRKGGQENHLGILNYGLLIITFLAACRFFDTGLSFVMRGLLFVAIGVGFFLTNYWMLQKRKKNGL